MVASLNAQQIRRWLTGAMELAPEHPGAAAALTILLMGLRPSEICRARVGQLEEGGRLLRLLATRRGWRSSEDSGLLICVPAALQALLARLARGKAPTAPLFPHEDGGWAHTRWVGEWVRRICYRAEVPVLSPLALGVLHEAMAAPKIPGGSRAGATPIPEAPRP